MTADPTPERLRNLADSVGNTFGNDDVGEGGDPNCADYAYFAMHDAANEIERLTKANAELRHERDLARSSDVPYLLGMLEAFDVPAPEFVARNQARWLNSLAVIKEPTDE